jgi:hypothetical protein
LTIAAAEVQVARRVLPANAAMYGLIGSLPVWWLLGMGNFIWPLMAIPLAASIIMRRRATIPRGFGIWLLFMAWMLVSAGELDTPSRGLAFAYRAALYLAATVVFVYVYNATRRRVSMHDVVHAFAFYWLCVVIGGWLGVLFPSVSFASPMESVMPASLLQNAFVHDMVHLRLAVNSSFLGYVEGRPVALFNYTNNWGAAFGFLVPFAVAAQMIAHSHAWKLVLRIALVASIVPAVFSLNRGLWLALILGAAYIAIRYGQWGRLSGFVGVAAGVVVVFAIVSFTALGGLVHDRFSASSGSTTTRSALYTEATQRVMDSPLFGFGAPRPSDTRNNAPSVGTQSQLFLVLFSHGFPAIIAFVGFFVHILWRTRRSPPGPYLWIHVAILIALIESPYYELSTLLPLIFIAMALLYRELHDGQMHLAVEKSGGHEHATPRMS